MLTVAQLQVEVGANTAPAEAGLSGVNDQVEKSGGLFSGLKGFAGSALSTLMGFVGGQIVMQGLNMVVGQVTQLFGSMMDETQNLSDAENLLNARLSSTNDAVGMTAGAINGLSDAQESYTGIAKSTILQGDDMLLTFTNIGQTVFPDASNAMLDLAVSMNHGKTAGADLQSSAILLGKALDDPLKGISALTRVGVTFSDQQKQQIKDFMAMGDTADAQKVILQELNREFGGTAHAASETFGGSIDKLKNMLIDFGANAIGKVETWLQPFVTMLADDLPGALDKAGQFLGKVGGDISSFFSSMTGGKGINIGSMFGDLTKGMNFGAIVKDLQQFGATIQAEVLPIALQLSDWFQKQMLPAIGSVLPVIQSLGQTFVNDIVPAFIQVESAAFSVGTTVAKTFLPIFEAVEPVVVRLTGYVLDLANKGIKFLVPYVEDAFKAISQFATEMSTRLQPFIHTLVGAFQEAVNIIGPLWNIMWPYMSEVLKTAWDLISGIVKILWDTITSIFKIGADLLSGNWGQLWKDVQGMAETFHQDVVKLLGTLWSDVEGLFTKGKDMLGTIWGDLWNGLSGAASTAWDDVKGIIADGINGAIGLINDLIAQADKVPGVSIPQLSPVHFASGGIMPYGGMAIVGENGPEAVALPGGSQVFNAAQTQRMFGQPQIVNNFNGITSDASLVQRLRPLQQQQMALVFGGSR